MTKRITLLLLFAFFIAGLTFAQPSFEYPKAKKGDQIDDYHGTKVSGLTAGSKIPSRRIRAPGSRRKIN